MISSPHLCAFLTTTAAYWGIGLDPVRRIGCTGEHPGHDARPRAAAGENPCRRSQSPGSRYYEPS